MQPKHISIGVIIGIALIFYWYMKDHPRTLQPPVRDGFLTISMVKAA